MKFPEQANPPREKVDQYLPGAAGRGRWRLTAKGYGIFCLGNKMFQSQTMVMVAQLSEYIKRHIKGEFIYMIISVKLSPKSKKMKNRIYFMP